MRVSLADLIDRYAIVKLKIQNHGEEETLLKELNAVDEAIKEYANERIILKKEWFEDLYIINLSIWNLESDIRKGKEKELGLEEVGRRAITIRNLNKKRVALKNEIIEATHIGFKDIKINHASE